MRLKITLSSLLFLGYFCFAQAQVSVQGQIKDTLSLPLSGASISLLYEEDSTLASFAFSDDEGKFFIEDVETGQYIVSISYLGYGTFQRALIVENENIDYGNILLNPAGISLEGVEVKADFIPIVIKKDTIEYHADAFKTKQNAVVEDLLKKLPGVEVDKDGTIKAQGKEVQNILVDGEEFFGSDTKIATKNIPADIVDKVQVYDKQSELSELTGIDDGEREKTINLKIKEGKKKGWFGNATAGATADNHYLAGGMLNRFTNKTQFSAIANANNINEQLFSIMDYIQFGGGIGALSNGTIELDNLPMNLLNRNGITDAQSGGINLSHKFSKKSKLNFNFFVDNSVNNTNSSSNGISLLEESASETISDNEEEQASNSYRLKAKWKHQFSPKATLIASSAGVMSGFENDTKGTQQFFLNDSKLRSSEQISNQNTQQFDIDNKLLYFQKLKKIGRSLSIRGNVRLQNSDYDGTINNQGFSYLGNQVILADTIIQVQEQTGKLQAQGLSFDFIETLDVHWKISPFAKWNKEMRESRQYFYDLNNGRAEITDLYSDYERQTQNIQLGTSLTWKKKQFTSTVTLAYQTFNLDKQSINGAAIDDANFDYFKPSVFMRYKLSSSKSINFNYQTAVDLPSLRELQPVVDNSNPNFIYKGNPLLQPVYIHTWNTSYNSFNQFYGRNLMLRLEARLLQNSIVSQRSIDENLITTSQPINGGDNWEGSVYANYEMAIKPWGIKWKTNQNLNYSNNIFWLNGKEDRINNYVWQGKLAVENRYQSTIAAELGFGININHADYQENNNYNQTLNTQQVYTDATWFISEKWDFSLVAQHKWFNDSKLESLNFVDLSVSHYLLDNKLEITLEGNNLFGENEVFQQNAFENSINTSSVNRLGRYFLLKFNYKFRQFGK